MAEIHPSAIVEVGAELGENVVVGPFCFVGKKAKIGDGTKLHSHVVIAGVTTVGKNNEIFPFASVGHAPQDLKYNGEETLLFIGDNNKIRECTTLQPGTVQGGNQTIIGNGNLFMAYTHVAHDCVVGNNNVIANCSQLAGHVTIGDGTIISAHSGIHQFCRIGDLGMTAAGAMVTQDVPPYCQVQGDRAKLVGINLVALKRRGYSAEAVSAVRAAYKLLFFSQAPTVEEAVARCEAQGVLKFPEVQVLVNFVKESKRGVTRPAEDKDARVD